MTNKSPIQETFAIAKQVIVSPATFYRGMAKSGGYLAPGFFLIVMAMITGLVIALLLSFATGDVTGLFAFGLGSFIMIPLAAIFSCVLATSILFIIWKLMGSRESFETAFRCVAYASAIYPITLLLNLIPYLGVIIGVIWGAYLMICASVETHYLNYKKTVIVFSLLGGIALLANLNMVNTSRELESRLKELEGLPPDEARARLEEIFRRRNTPGQNE